jgi:hypothetical protein
MAKLCGAKILAALCPPHHMARESEESRSMSSPIIVDLSHSLGLEEAKRRIDSGMGRLGDHIPGGAARVEKNWSGDTMRLLVEAMGQEVRANLAVSATSVRLEVVLPPALSFFSGPIAALLRREGATMLEDKRKG